MPIRPAARAPLSHIASPRGPRESKRSNVDVLEVALRACVVLFMVAGLAGAGLGVEPGAALARLADRRFVVLTLGCGWLLCPAAALLLLALIPLDRPYATALLLLALAPCAPFAPAKVRAAHGDPAAMAAFVVLTAAGTVLIMPVAVPLILASAVDPWDIARPLVFFVLLPLLAGLALRASHPRAADAAHRPVAAAARAATAALVVLVAVLHGRGILDAVGSHAIAVQALFVAAVTVGADWIGAGLPHGQRTVLTIGLSTRNLGAALAPLAALDADPRAIVMIAIAVPLTMLASAAAAHVLARRALAGAAA
jgi:BASS family bile acid:Na+ symporter